MSNPSIKSPKSPSAQWLSNEDAGVGKRQSSDDAAVSAQTARRQPAVTTGDNGDARDTLPIRPAMSYPVDENLFYSAPSQLLDSTSQTQHETEYQEPAVEELVHPADFRAFFTLIEDSEQDEHHHPTVHYIFSDDDPEIITSAALEALDEIKESRHSDDVEERCVVLDMSPDGKSVAAAASMSSDWQALKTSVSQAPSWGDDSKKSDAGLMLKISGRERRPLEKDKRRERQSSSLDELVTAFGARLGGLDEILGKGDHEDDQLGVKR